MVQKYVYAVAQTSCDAALRGTGVGGSTVYAIARHGLGCFLSDYSGRELRALPKEEVVRSLLAHQAVVEEIMEKHAILPVKFGTVVDGEAEAFTFLSQGHRRLAEALVQLQDKVEVEVAATWDTTLVLRELSNREEIAQAKAAAAGMSPEDVMQQHIRLGQLLKEALDQRRDEYRERMLEFLRPLAVDVQPNVLVSDQMVMNVAFLVQRAQQPDFDERVGELNDLFNDQINFRIIGPLPPYSFATVEVARPSWQTLEEARLLLHLGETVSEPEVRRSYRRLAAECHPDLRGKDEGAAEHLARLRGALETLLAYCRECAVSGDGSDAFLITREAVERSLLISVKRTSTQEVDQSRFGGMASRTGFTGPHAAGC